MSPAEGSGPCWEQRLHGFFDLPGGGCVVGLIDNSNVEQKTVAGPGGSFRIVGPPVGELVGVRRVRAWHQNAKHAGGEQVYRIFPAQLANQGFGSAEGLVPLDRY